MHSLIESFNNPALAAASVLAIYAYIRVTAAWIVALLSHHAECAANQPVSPDD